MAFILEVFAIGANDHVPGDGGNIQDHVHAGFNRTAVVLQAPTIGKVAVVIPDRIVVYFESPGSLVVGAVEVEIIGKQRAVQWEKLKRD